MSGQVTNMARTIVTLRQRVAELEAALREAVTVIEGLADQQAMADDWYREPLAHLKAVAK